MNETPAGPVTFGGAARWKSRLAVAIGLILAIYNLFLANIVVFRHPARFDLTAERVHSLSQATLDKLKLVEEEIQVVIPTNLHRDVPELLAYHDVLSRTRLLLNEYMAVQPRIKIASEVDVLADPERWEEVRARFDLDSSQVNRFIFITGPAKDLRQTVTPTDLASFAPARDAALGAPEIKGFRGEKAITDAISRLISGKRNIVYFTTDRGELLLRPKASQNSVAGLRAVLHELETEGMEARELSLSSAKEIPPDCSLLVVAGPTQIYSRDELGIIDAYLQRGGHLLVTLQPRRTGIEDLLKEWGVEVLDGKVQGQMSTALEQLATAQVAARSFAREHPATKIFQTVPRFEVQLILPRPLRGTGTGKGLDPTALLAANSDDNEFFFLVPDRPSRELPKPGNFELAVAVEQRVPDRPPPGFQRQGTRVVVVGATSFVSDQYFLRASHRDFLMNAIAWLIGEEDKATVSGQEWAERVLRTSPAIEKFLFWVPIFLLPAVFLGAGALLYYLRRT